MRPRLSPDREPIGTRKKKKREQPTRKNSPPPSALHYCQCFECRQYPSPDPETGMPSQGGWLSRKELEKHVSEERKRGVATQLLQTLEHPSSNLPYPVLGFMPSSSSIPAHPAPTSLPPSSFMAPSPPVLPQTAPEIGLKPDQNKTGLEVAAFKEQLQSAEEVFDQQFIVFQHRPSHSQLDVSLLLEDEIDLICRLDTSVRSNTSIVAYLELLADAEKWLCKHPAEANSDIGIRLKIKALAIRVPKERSQIRRLLLEEWKHQADVNDLSNSFDSTQYHLQTFKSLPPIVFAVYLLVATLHLVCGLSMDHCSFVLGCLRLIVSLALEHSSSLFAPTSQKAIYTDVRTVIDILDLNPRTNAYVSCPSCCKTYWIDPNDRNSFPDHCTNGNLDGQACGAKLKRLRKRRHGAVYAPIRQYCHQPMANYVARLYARPDLQPYLLGSPVSRRGGAAEDIWDAPALRNLRGPDKKPFISGSSSEGRLIFSLNMDNFNPFSNKEAGKKVSVGAIYMICLNLPPSIRYNIENVYLVGMIPGPREPSLHQINHYLRPLVDDLLVFWTTGMYISRTYRFPRGILVRCAVVPLVCDLPATRQMSGFAHYRSRHFCSVCMQNLHDIQNINPQTWVPRDNTAHRMNAERWLHATSQKDREKITNETGVSWSELLRLPYWDPVQYTIIDSMHAFYLRLFQHHCRSIWGMNIKLDDGEAFASGSKSPPPSEQDMRKANHVFEYGTKTALQSLSVGVMRQLCRETATLNSHGRKGALLQRLLDYRVRQGWFSEGGQRLRNSQGEEEMQADPLNRPVVLNPQIQSFAQQGVIPNELFLRSTYDVEDYFRNADKLQMSRLTRRDLLTLFVHKVLPDMNLSVAAVNKLVVAELRDLIRAARKAQGIIDDDERPYSRPPPPKKTAVLGKGVLSEVRKDMEHLDLPSWMPKAPAHPGEEAWGKFSADQWKTFCIYVLPITLIRIWGDKPAESLEHRQLENFMHLVAAVKLASLRRITESHIQQYEDHMHAYLSTLQNLYPDLEITPYQHLSLHFGEQLRRFGPVHAWRCFAFERYNYIMQNFPTNGIFGELETTMFEKFCRAQNIRALFSEEALPAVLRPMLGLFNKAFHADTRGTRLGDILLPSQSEAHQPARLQNSVRLSVTNFTLLQAWVYGHDDLCVDSPIDGRAWKQDQLERFGMKYTAISKSPNDSRISYQVENGTWAAGVIQEMFAHRRERSDGSTVTQTFAVVAPFKSLSGADQQRDWYREFPAAAGKLFYNSFEKEKILLSMDQIKAHCGARVYKEILTRESLLAIPLEK